MGTLLAPIAPPRALPVDGAGLMERARLTLLGLAMALLGLPVALVIGIFWLVALPLSPVLVGLPILFAAVPAGRGIAEAHRRISGALLATPIPDWYAPTTGHSPPARLFTWLRDPARWRDFGFLWFSATGGFVLSLLPAGILATIVAHAIGRLVDGGIVWWFLVLLDGPLLLVWWLATPHLARARALADQAILGPSRVVDLENRVLSVEESRTETLDHQAAEVRRIERDLHDGAQARMAAVGMNVGLAEKLIATDPEAAAALLREARETTVSALEDMRSVVRGIRPPALSDLGLVGAVEALAVPMPIATTVSLRTPRLPDPIESAAYFAITECLANIVKHSEGSLAWVVGSHDGARLQMIVGDDGRGGADPEGTGLRGVTRRLDAFDGRVQVVSPPGGGTVVRMEIPCPL